MENPTNRELIQIAITKLRSIEHDIKIVKTDIQYLKLKYNCDKKVEEDKTEPKEDISIGWRLW